MGDPILQVQWEKDGPVEEFCGYSWCAGSCKLPALVIPALPGNTNVFPELKSYSDMVAHGPLMAPWRLKWTGTKREVPPEYREDFRARWWL